MNRYNFTNFCKDAGIMDSTLNSGILDTYFKATNFEEVE